MKAGHALIQRKGKGGGRGDLIQGIFTQRALQIANTITFKSQRQSQLHVLQKLFIRYCADQTSPKIMIPRKETM